MNVNDCPFELAKSTFKDIKGGIWACFSFKYDYVITNKNI